jgi:hypothetical protein
VTAPNLALPVPADPPRSTVARRPAPTAIVAGALAVTGNVLGVLFLHDMPAAYRLARLEEWVRAVTVQPLATTASAFSFVVGLVAMAVWARHLGERLGTTAARTGALLIAVGALVNAAGATTPLVQALHVGACGPSCDAVGRALLGMTLALDGVFNLLLGVGLLLTASAVGRGGWLRPLMLAAGIATVPVSAQAVWDPAASLLYVAAPLWLAVIVWTSARDVGSR